MATYAKILKPYSQYNSMISKASSTYDNNTTTYGYALNTGNSILLLNINGDDFSLPVGAEITAVRADILMGEITAVSNSIRFVTDATSYSSYTDCGDGAISFDAVEGWNSIYMPSGVDYCKNNLNKILDDKFGLRIVLKAKYLRVYEAYIVIEYTLPTITVTTNASPTEGGIVTGGGTYENGSTVTATATPNTGYAFSHWLINGANAGSSNPISGALTSDTTVTAVFEKVETSKIYKGINTVSVYRGNKKVSVYIGTNKIT